MADGGAGRLGDGGTNGPNGIPGDEVGGLRRTAAGGAYLRPVGGLQWRNQSLLS